MKNVNKLIVTLEMLVHAIVERQMSIVQAKE